MLQRVHPEDLIPVQEVIDRASHDAKDFDLEHRLQLPDGSSKHVHVVAHAGQNESGQLEYVGAVMDVTERKRLKRLSGSANESFGSSLKLFLTTSSSSERM